MARANPEPIDALLQTLWDRGGTDLLLTVGAPPMLRIDGLMQRLDGADPLDPEEIERLMKAVLTDNQLQELVASKEIDFSFDWQERARFRANAFHQRGNMALALRLIPFRIPGFEELGLPPVVESFVKAPYGLVLVTGPTGSGKSTTLAAMIDWINSNKALHIVTIEDPIEYTHAHRMSAVNQREVGEDSHSFERALRSALREDPDVLLVGEMRDLETIQIALT
ncbi:MAG: type IV pilus twitching motility protein PilT, partial [Actinomycetota bacterium]